MREELHLVLRRAAWLISLSQVQQIDGPIISAKGVASLWIRDQGDKRVLHIEGLSPYVGSHCTRAPYEGEGVNKKLYNIHRESRQAEVPYDWGEI